MEPENVVFTQTYISLGFNNSVINKVTAEIWKCSITTTKSKLLRNPGFKACDVIKGCSVVLTRLGRREDINWLTLWTNDSSKGELPVRGLFSASELLVLLWNKSHLGVKAEANNVNPQSQFPIWSERNSCRQCLLTRLEQWSIGSVVSRFGWDVFCFWAT